MKTAKCKLGIDDWNCLTCQKWRPLYQTRFDCFNDNKYKYPKWLAESRKEPCPMQDPEKRAEAFAKFNALSKDGER